MIGTADTRPIINTSLPDSIASTTKDASKSAVMDFTKVSDMAHDVAENIKDKVDVLRRS